MKKKLSVFLLLVSLVFSGTGCFPALSVAAWTWWEDMFLIWLLSLDGFFYHHECGSCDIGCGVCSAASPQWAATAKAGPDASLYYSTAASGNGVYAAGSITGDRVYDFGKSGYASAGFTGGTNALLVNYDTGGAPLWTATVSSAPDNSCYYAVASDGNGIYAAGTMDGDGNFSFGSGVNAAGHYASGSNSLLVRYDSGGAPVWARSVTTGTGASSLYAVAAGYDGIYVSGLIMGNAAYDFGNGVTVTGAGSGANAVIVKYDRSGTPLWARTVAAGTGDSCFMAVAVEGGYVFAGGYITGSNAYDFGDSKTASGAYGGPNAVIVKYSSTGAVHWVQSVSAGANESAFQSIAVSGDRVYAAGHISGIGRYDFGNGKQVIGGGNGLNAVLVQYDISGAAQWTRSVTSNPDDSCYTSVSAGSDGVYAAGFINGKLPYNFGNAMIASGTYESGPNALLVKYGTSGVTQWARSVQSGRLESCFQSITAADTGIYSAGYIYGTGPYEFWNGLSAAGAFTGSNCVMVKY